MKVPPLDTHSIVSYIGALALTAFIFLHPTGITPKAIAYSFGLVGVGQAGGNLAKGAQRRLQGGSTAPDTIVPPAQPAPEATPVPLVPTNPKG